MVTRTKIVCTIGPAVDSLDQILSLIQAGMNVARLNFSHGTHEDHLRMIQYVKKARKQLQCPLPIMLDTKGPEIRIGEIEGGQLKLPAGHKWLLVQEEVVGNLSRVTVQPAQALEKVKKGTRFLFDDGYIASHAVEASSEGVVVQIENEGVIQSGKGVNIPNVALNLPAVTEQDVADIKFGCQHDVEIIAASFVRSADQVLEIKKLLAEENKADTVVIAKIENSEGVQDFDNIVQVADGIMIARGDLGVEVPISQVPRLQKMMIRKSCLAGKPSVTSTQMLDSMIKNPRPTRAEASDIANAIYDSTSAVMLSGETAIGSYPIEVVNVMKSIIEEAENDFNYRAFFDQYSHHVYHDVPAAVTLATVKTAYSSHAKAIFAFTSRGSTARMLSSLRPPMPIIAMTPNEKCYHQLTFQWGVVPFLDDHCTSIDEAFRKISTFALERHDVSYGDLVVVTAGTPFGVSGTTNMMIVENIGDVLIRGYAGHGDWIHGKVTLVMSPNRKKAYEVQGRLLVLAKCHEGYRPLIQEAAGVILQNHVDDHKSEKYAMKLAVELHKPTIVRADGATQILKEGQLVTLDPEKALVYKGVALKK